MDLPMAMHETALDALNLIKGREIMDSLSLVMDIQKLIVEGDKDPVMDTLKIHLHNQGLMVGSHPLGETVAPTMDSQHHAQEEDKNHSVSSQTDPDAQTLNMDNCPLDPEQADIMDPA